MHTTSHIPSGASRRLASVALLVLAFATCTIAGPRASAHAAVSATSYGWPVKPFDRPHPIRGSFGDPRTVFSGSPSLHTLMTGGGIFQFHFGVDISAPDHTPVYPVESGTVASVSKDEIVVDSSDRVFEYWHLDPAVAPGDHVDVDRTVLGRIHRDCGHVHLTERDGGIAVNPLAPGHLTPYRDTTKPTVDSIAFRDGPTGGDLMPELLRGRVEIVAAAEDTPAMPVRGTWHDLPVTPALVQWQIRRATDHKVVVPMHTVFDVRHTLPSNDDFWRIYARGTHQNMAVFGKHYSYLQPGSYLFRLTPDGFDTRSLPDAVYEVVVTATDIAGNHGSLVERFSVHNRPGVVGA